MIFCEDLISIVNKITERLGIIWPTVRKVQIDELGRKHRDGYMRKPVKQEEFRDWESEQVWVEP